MIRVRNPAGNVIFLHSNLSVALGSTQLPVQWVPELFPGGKTAGAWS